jgi:hypothetical protein
VGVNVCQSFLQDVGGGAALDAQHEQPDEPLERVLIHRVDQGEVDDAEEEKRSSVGHGTVPFSGLVDLLLSYLALLHSLVDLLTGLLGVGELVDEGLVLQEFIDVALCAGQSAEDRVLDAYQGLPVLGVLLHDLQLLLLHLRVLQGHNLSQHLFLQPRRGDGEVDHRHLHEDLWGVVRVGQRGRHEELEALAVVDCLLPNGDGEAGTRLHNFLEEDGLKGGIKFLPHALEEHPLAELHC